MAGVYIPGMTIDEYEELCKYARYGANNAMIGGRKAIPVPDHGRLIDADALCEGRVSNDNVLIHAKCAPTVIPADREVKG